jgi:osmotically-inducible protein OsmY
MKMAKNLFCVSSLVLLAVGCARHDRFSDTAYYSPSYGAGGATSSSATTTTEFSTAQPSAQSTATSTASASTDQALSTQVQQCLKNDPATSTIAPQIQVSAQGGAVTLSGTVTSEQEKQRVETMVKSTSGVVNVNNQLQVALQPTSDRPDQGGRLYRESKTDAAAKADASETASALAAQARAETNRFESAATPATPATPATASTNQLTPTVTGESKDLTPTSQRTDAPNRIYGTNQTATAGAGDTFAANIQATSEADRSIGQQVIQQLRTDTSLAATLPTIKLAVDSGKITITGTVKNDDEKQKIETAVKGVTGVTTVENQLQVSTNPAATDSGK